MLDGIDIKFKRVVVETSKFGRNPTRTFRHFSSTSLCDAQAGNPILTDNFIKNYQGHENIELTKGLYANHLNRDTSPERLSPLSGSHSSKLYPSIGSR